MLKKTLLFLATAACMAATHASAQMLTISEVYGGGGNSGSTYGNDFIELYNNGTAAFNLTGYSLFYASATGAFSTTGASAVTALTGIIPAGGYYLVQEASGGTGTALPTPNQTGSIGLSATAGKVALALNGTNITAANTAGVLDFVGYGTTANLFEGAGAAPAPSAANSISRAVVAGVSVDTNNNNLDFTAGLPTPVPEPSNWVAVAGGVGLLSLVIRRRRLA